MDTWAPAVRYPHEGVGYWTNDTGTLAVNTTSGPLGGQYNLRVSAAATDTAGHVATGDQWADAYGEALIFPSTFTNANRKMGVWLRVADASNCYTVVADGTGTMTISKVVAGTPTSLGTASFTIGDVTDNVAFGAAVQGDLIRGFWRGQRVLTVQDTTYTGPGFVSMYLRTQTTTGELQCMRWEAGPLRPNHVAPYTSMAGSRALSRQLR